MKKIYHSIIIPVKCSKEDYQYLFKCNKESARVWNECIRLNTELWNTKQEYINRKFLQDNIKGNFSNILPAKAIQLISKKYISARTAVIRARKAGRTDLKYPYKEKKMFNTTWDYMMIYIHKNEGFIELQKPKLIINKKLIKSKIRCYIKPENIPNNICQIEVLFDNGLKLNINYYTEEESLQIKSNNICAVDLGEIHSIASVDNNGNSLIITGRKLRSINRFRNKELGDLNKRLKRCKKGSKNYKKYRKAIRKLCSKSEHKIRDAVNKTAKLFTDYVITNNINTVVVGDVRNFNMNLKHKKRKKGSQQKLVQWQHGRILKRITEKVNKYGVKVINEKEYYTSKTCPRCGRRHTPNGRNYICKYCGFILHRDLVGATNIMSRFIYNGKIKPLNLDYKPLKYLRIA